MKRRKAMNQNQESKVVEVEEKELKEVPEEQNETAEEEKGEPNTDEKSNDEGKKKSKKKFIVGGIIAAATAAVATALAVILRKDEPEVDDLSDIGDYPDRKQIPQKESQFEKISEQLSTIIDRLPVPGDDSTIE